MLARQHLGIGRLQGEMPNHPVGCLASLSAHCRYWDDGCDTGERHATDYDTSIALLCSTKSQLWRWPSMKAPKIGCRRAKRICPEVD